MSMANNNNIKVDQCVANIVDGFTKVSQTTKKRLFNIQISRTQYFATNNGIFFQETFHIKSFKLYIYPVQMPN